jgi:hypothetical protein
MPYKANEPRRHRIPRARYRVTNWPEYDRALQRRGSLTVWVTPEALAAWHPPKTGRRGRSRTYSDIAIETGHLLRLAFGRPWRQTEGLLRSLATLLGLDIGVPRPHHLLAAQPRPGARRLAGAGPEERACPRRDRRHRAEGARRRRVAGREARRAWPADLAQTPPRGRSRSGEILASELTTSEEGDAALVGPLLEQITGPIASVTADGATMASPSTAPSPSASPTRRGGGHPAPRHRRAEPDRRHRAHPARPAHPDDPGQGRLGWQKAVGYGRRSLGETAVSRYKAIIGRRLRARTLPARRPKPGSAARCSTG